jgi:hypothetical protein
MGQVIIGAFLVALCLLVARRPLMLVYRDRKRRASGGEPGDAGTPGPFGDRGGAGSERRREDLDGAP